MESIDTGAASGIGQAVAVAAARAGEHALVTDVNQTGLEQTVAAATEVVGRADAIRLDVSDAAQIEVFTWRVEHQFP